MTLSTSPRPTYIISTRNIHLAALCVYRGHTPIVSQASDGKVDFSFESDSENLAEVQRDFLAGRAYVEVLKFVECWKKVREMTPRNRA
jgi:hypothetical protein